jgi:hypothetical protein
VAWAQPVWPSGCMGASHKPGCGCTAPLQGYVTIQSSFLTAAPALVVERCCAHPVAWCVKGIVSLAGGGGMGGMEAGQYGLVVGAWVSAESQAGWSGRLSFRALWIVQPSSQLPPMGLPFGAAVSTWAGSAVVAVMRLVTRRKGLPRHSQHGLVAGAWVSVASWAGTVTAAQKGCVTIQSSL